MGLPKGRTNNLNGRPVGSLNKSSLHIKEVISEKINLDMVFERLEDLTGDSNERVALEAIKIILAYRYGKPRELIEIDNTGQAEGIAGQGLMVALAGDIKNLIEQEKIEGNADRVGFVNRMNKILDEAEESKNEPSSDSEIVN